MGAQLVREVANKTSDLTGDGTTTATLLAQAIVREGMTALEEGANPMLLRRGIEDATELSSPSCGRGARRRRRRSRTSPTSRRSPPRRTSGSASRWRERSHRVGPEGVVTIEESAEPGIEVEFVEGMHVDNGHFSPYLIQDTQRMETRLRRTLHAAHEQADRPHPGPDADARRGDEEAAAAGHLRREGGGRRRSDCSSRTTSTGRSRRWSCERPGSDTAGSRTCTTSPRSPAAR